MGPDTYRHVLQVSDLARSKHQDDTRDAVLAGEVLGLEF